MHTLLLPFWGEFWVLKKMFNKIEAQRGQGVMKTLILGNRTLYTGGALFGLWSAEASGVLE